MHVFGENHFAYKYNYKKVERKNKKEVGQEGSYICIYFHKMTVTTICFLP